ncbi:MAG: hypothetical protein AB7U35_07925 [Sphingobium sp.]
MNDLSTSRRRSKTLAHAPLPKFGEPEIGTAWATAVHNAREAYKTSTDQYVAIMQPANLAYAEGQVTAEEVRHAEDAWYAYSSRYNEIVIDLVKTPAPSLADVVSKIEIIKEEQFLCDEWGFLDQIIADLRRLGNAS